MIKDIDKPVRKDHDYTFSLVKSLVNMRLGLILIFIICLVQLFLILSFFNRPKLIAVIDSEGKTHSTTAYTQNNTSNIERQVIYYSRIFCESFYSENFSTIESDRSTAYNLMHPDLQAQLSEGWKERKSYTNILSDNITNRYDWLIKPSITSSKDPVYTVFCQFTRVTNKSGFLPKEERFNIKLQWGRLTQNTDFFNRPHDLILISLNNLKEGDKELNLQLNLIK